MWAVTAAWAQIGLGLVAWALLGGQAAADDADDWGEPPPAAATAGAASARAVPRFVPATVELAGRKVEYACPEGWKATALDGAPGLALLPPPPLAGAAAAGGEDAALALFVSAPDVDLARAAQELGFDLPKDDSGETATERVSVGGYEARRAFASRTEPGSGRRFTAVFQDFEAGGLRVLVVAFAPAERFAALEVPFLLAAHQIRLADAPPERPLWPAVLDPVPAPARPLEGFYWRRGARLELDVRSGSYRNVADERILGFTRDGLVVDGYLPPDAAAFDAVRHSALDPVNVGTYAFDGTRLRIRWPSLEKPEDLAVEPRSDGGGESLKIGPYFYRRLDIELAGVPLAGAYLWENVTFVKGVDGAGDRTLASRRRLVFRADGTFEASGGFLFYAVKSLDATTPGLADYERHGYYLGGERASEVERGRYALGRGNVLLTYEDGGRQVRLPLRIDGPRADPAALGAIIVGGLVYLRE